MLEEITWGAVALYDGENWLNQLDYQLALRNRKQRPKCSKNLLNIVDDQVQDLKSLSLARTGI